jgi:ubiquinone biosynthesis protein UbiJ
MGVAAALANRLFGRDDWTRERLAAQAGKVARVRCGPWRADFRIGPAGELISVVAAQPDVTLTVPARSMLDAPEFPERAAQAIVVEGDPDVGAAMVDVARVAPWLCESALAAVTGPAAANRLAALVRAAVRVPRYAAGRLRSSAGAYFSDEISVAVRRRELERHATSIGELAQRLDALTARVHAAPSATPDAAPRRDPPR